MFLYSKQMNAILTSFPDWFPVFDADDPDDIPIGTITNFIHSCGQGWQVIIFEKRDVVYIMQGTEFGNESNEFTCWYAVSRLNYLKEWNTVQSLRINK